VRVLVAIDGSDDAKAAVAWLSRLPLPAGHNIRLFTTVVPPVAWIDVDKAHEVRAALVAEAQRLVDDTASELRLRRDFTSGGVVVANDAREAIIAAARDWDADLIAMGARGLGAVARFFLGSVSLAVVRDAPCPVLVCKGPPRELDAITVALDGSDHARQALEWLTHALTLPPSTRLRLLGVAEAYHYPSSTPGTTSAWGVAVGALRAERLARLEAELSAAATSLRARLPAIETAVLAGETADMIVGDVEHRRTDLVVLGARGLGTVRRLLLGSVSESVLRHAACSVLIVRPQTS
jgi:nucleotide-binding universal stress UspA family protein